jgi:general stress protein YciG
MAGNQDRTTGSSSSGDSNRGFASMDEKKQHEVASKGGQSVPDEERSFSKDRELAAEAGKKGGQSRSGSGGSSSSSDQSTSEGRGGGGNFAEDPERASEAGRKGGQH